MSRDFDRATDVFENALISVHLIHGGIGSGGGKPRISVRRLNTVWREFPLPTEWSGKDCPEGIAAVAEVLRSLEASDHVPGWVRCPRVGALCHVPDSHPAAKKRHAVHSMCCITIAKDEGRWTSFSTCDREVLTSDLARCKVHDGVRTRQATKRAADLDRQRVINERNGRTAAIANEVRELWNLVCDERDIVHRGRPTTQDGGNLAVVDSEVLRLLLRELIER